MTMEQGTQPETVKRLKKARAIVDGSVLYRRFISGTPLENDIAVWIEEFAAAETRALEIERDMLRSHAESHNRDYASLAKKLDETEAECERLKMQIDGLVAPEELRQWQAECERLRALLNAQADEPQEYYIGALRLVADELSKLTPESFAGRRDKLVTTIIAAARSLSSVQALRKALDAHIVWWTECLNNSGATGQAAEEMLSDIKKLLAGGEAATREKSE